MNVFVFACVDADENPNLYLRGTVDAMLNCIGVCMQN